LKAGIVAKQHARGIENYLGRVGKFLREKGIKIAVEEGINEIVH